MYIPRTLEPKLLEYLRIFPAVAITGPRQSGKSTLLKHLFKQSYQYVTFDDPVNVRLFSDDPEGFFQTYSDKVIFDEAQKVPEIFDYVKLAIDKDRSHVGKFILTGSAQFNLMHKISESLAGRIGLLSLLPFEHHEVPEVYRGQAIFRGQYPELSLHQYQHCEPWYSSYIGSYLEKDVRSIHDIGNLRDFNRLLYLLATQVAQPLNMAALATQVGVSPPTIKRWISVLEASYIIFLLPPFYENYGKRLTKAPKLYFYDTGIVSYLLGIETEKQYRQGPLTGAIFENYVISECHKKITHRQLNYQLYYFRTHHGVEVDLIIDKKHAKEFIEIKHSSTFHAKMVSTLLTLQSMTEENTQFTLLYSGEPRPQYRGVNLLPFDRHEVT